MRRITINLLVVVLALAVAACGSGDDTTNRIRTGSIPTGSDALVLRIDTRGGFTPAEYQLAIVPELSLFGDGRVVVTGPVTEQYPPHALPNLLTGVLTRSEVQRLVRRAADTGLLDRPLDFGQPGVTDMPTTTVTVDDGSRHTQSAYALQGGPTDGLPGLAAAQRDARDRLNAFVEDATAAATRVATEPYRASEVAVYARRAEPVGIDDVGIEPGRADWPLGDLATTGAAVGGPGADPAYRCAVLGGREAERALAAAAGASSITRWQSGGRDYRIVFRPLLPDEHACP